MNAKKNKPIAQDAYNAMAESYAALVDTKPHNAYYERPATFSLLPDVQGKRVLDAGCGPGSYAEWLVNHGAEVVAFDVNEKMVRLARKRLGNKAQILHANLEQPLDFLKSNSFDLAISTLVLDYIWDWGPVFLELHRVLKNGGNLVFSIEHPYWKHFVHHDTSNYFDTEKVEYTWTGFGSPVNVPYYRRPLSKVVNPLIEAGFILEKILEPLPTKEFKEKDPEDYERLIKQPSFICVRASKG
ncbi:MAG: class I SAM-dependent methyltransferase [Anaerolineales bacterium]|jgi:SAM-dependent methyltransferase